MRSLPANGLNEIHTGNCPVIDGRVADAPMFAEEEGGGGKWAKCGFPPPEQATMMLLRH